MKITLIVFINIFICNLILVNCNKDICFRKYKYSNDSIIQILKVESSTSSDTLKGYFTFKNIKKKLIVTHQGVIIRDTIGSFLNEEETEMDGQLVFSIDKYLFYSKDSLLFYLKIDNTICDKVILIPKSIDFKSHNVIYGMIMRNVE